MVICIQLVADAMFLADGAQLTGVQSEQDWPKACGCFCAVTRPVSRLHWFHQIVLRYVLGELRGNCMLNGLAHNFQVRDLSIVLDNEVLIGLLQQRFDQGSLKILWKDNHLHGLIYN